MKGGIGVDVSNPFISPHFVTYMDPRRCEFIRLKGYSYPGNQIPKEIKGRNSYDKYHRCG